jgi:hypothetical protein
MPLPACLLNPVGVDYREGKTDEGEREGKVGK